MDKKSNSAYKMNQILNDEKNLFELIQTLLNNKWLIGSFVVLSSLIGFGYSQVAQSIYKVSVPYKINIYSLGSKHMCENNIECLEYESRKKLKFLFKGKWGSDLSFLTKLPLDSSKYKAKLNSLNKELANQMYIEAKIEETLIQSQLNEIMLSREITARNMIDAKRLIQYIDLGHTPLTFGDISVVKTSPKSTLITTLSIVFGGLFGVFFILLRNYWQKKKSRFLKHRKN